MPGGTHVSVFSKHTLIEICPFEENTRKQELRTVLHPFFTPKQDFNKNMHCVEFKKDPFP